MAGAPGRRRLEGSASWLAGAVLGCLGLGMFGYLQAKRRAEPAPSLAAWDPAKAPIEPPGLVEVVAFNLLAETAAGNAAPDGGASAIGRISGTLQVITIAKDDRTTTRSLRMANAHAELRVRDESQSAWAAQAERCLKEGFLSESDHKGRVLGVRLSDGCYGQAASAAKETAFWVEYSPASGERTYRALESSPLGPIWAEYEAHPGVTKRWHLLKAGASPALSTNDYQGVAEYDLSPTDGLPAAWAGEAQRWSSLGETLLGRTTSKLEARRISARLLAPTELESERTRVGPLLRRPLVALDAATGHVPTLELPGALPHRPLGSLRDEAKREASVPPEKRSHDARRALIERLFAHPEEVATIAGELRYPKANDPWADEVAGILAELGAPQAQDALVELVERFRPEPPPSIVSRLGTIESPTNSVTRLLERLARNASEEVSTTAWYALGASAHHLLEQGDERGSRWAELLQRELLSRTDENGRIVMINALGNTGAREAAGVLVTASRDQAWKVRAAAAFALRFIETPEVEARLLEIVQRDDDPWVRTRGAAATGFRAFGVDAMNRLEPRFVAERDAQVRSALLDSLWPLRRSFPDVVDRVRELASSDDDPGLRERARELLLSETAE
jgi:hypothetical protein